MVRASVPLYPGGAARKLYKILLKVRAAGAWWSPGFALMAASPPSPGRRETEQAAPEPKKRS